MVQDNPDTAVMHNVNMVGIQLDRFNLQGSLVVIGIFTAITLLSYFNELAK